MRKRNLSLPIVDLALARGKMAFITGPRQVGKTTLAKMLNSKSKGQYYNWDDLDFRRAWTKSPKGIVEKMPGGSTLILDEIHKASKWKQNLKGLYDTLEKELKIIVTGSTKLNTYRRGSDSLMGRYLGFRLHPFSVGEMLPNKRLPPDALMNMLQDGPTLSAAKGLHNIWKDLCIYGGFPEPLLSSSQRILNIWQKERVEKIVREELRDLSRIPELSRIEMLISLLPERAASSLSLSSLREDLETSYSTVKRWTDYLRALYYHFEIKPWSKNISRSLKKESKLYLWDWSEIKDPGQRFENMVASHLLKACHYWTDTGEGTFDLYYLKTKEKREVDFLITRNGTPWLPIECKMSDTTPSPNFSLFAKSLKVPVFIQLVERAGPAYLEKAHVGEKTLWVWTAAQFFRHLP